MSTLTPAAARAKLRRDHLNHIHPSITAERVLDAVEGALTSLDDPGFCLACGARAEGCEPDARQYECESCGAAAATAPKKFSSPSPDTRTAARAITS
jgi:hypothetical protein